jgi:hypothetical protein
LIREKAQTGTADFNSASICGYTALIIAQSCVRMLNGKYDLSKLPCPSYNLFPQASCEQPLLSLAISDGV